VDLGRWRCPNVRGQLTRVVIGGWLGCFGVAFLARGQGVRERIMVYQKGMSRCIQMWWSSSIPWQGKKLTECGDQVGGHIGHAARPRA
jgi:hypothetical protein